MRGTPFARPLHLLTAACAGQVKQLQFSSRPAGFIAYTGTIPSCVTGTGSGPSRLKSVRAFRESNTPNEPSASAQANSYLRSSHPRVVRSAVASAMTTSAGDTSKGIDGGKEQQLPYQYKWPRPAVTVDCLVYTFDEGQPWILLIKRKNDPCKGSWALPGGFVDENEGLDTAARRELEEETGVIDRAMVQTGAYGDPGRDPRGHTVTVAFMAWAPSRAACNAQAGDDAAEAEFFPVSRLPRMAFDHLKIITDSWTRCLFQKNGSEETARAVTDSPVGHDGLAVVDKASGQTLGVYPAPGGGARTGIDVLQSLQPTEE